MMGAPLTAHQVLISDSDKKASTACVSNSHCERIFVQFIIHLYHILYSQIVNI